MTKKGSSPNNIILSPKDNVGIKDTADNKVLSEDVSIAVYQDSSP